MSERSRISSVFLFSQSFQTIFTRKACLVKERTAMLGSLPRPLGRPLIATLASVTRCATLPGRSIACLASIARRSCSCVTICMHGMCSVEAHVAQLAWHAWRRMEGRRMARGETERGMGDVSCKLGRICDGRCGCRVLVCTLVAGTQRMSHPDTRNLVEVWSGASRHGIYLVECIVNVLPIIPNA